MTITDGELWTRGALEELRRADFKPSAWIRFLAASLRRADETRRARPDLARQARRWCAIGVGGAAAAREIGWAVGLPMPRRPPALAWWSATGAMLGWHLGMVETERGEPRTLSAAEALTMARVALVPFVAAAVPSRRLFMGLLGAAAATDLADGPLARRAGSTRLGRDLDPAADVAFLVAAGRSARAAGWLPGPAAGVITVRAVTPLVLLSIGYFRNARRPDTDAFGEARWTSPLVYGGLMLGAIGRRRAGGAATAIGSLGALASFASGAPARRASRALNNR